MVIKVNLEPRVQNNTFGKLALRVAFGRSHRLKIFLFCLKWQAFVLQGNYVCLYKSDILNQQCLCSSVTFSFRVVNRKKSVRLNKGYVWLLVWNMSWFEVLHFVYIEILLTQTVIHLVIFLTEEFYPFHPFESLYDQTSRLSIH